MRVLATLQTWAQRVERNGYAPLLALTVAIQGTVLVSQTLASLLVPLERIGAIRTFESIASVAILCASLGSQTLAIRELAAARPGQRERVLAELLALPVLGAGAFCLVGLGLLLTGRLPAGVGEASLGPAILLLLLVSMVRLLSGAAQGMFQVAAVYRWVVLGSGAAVACHLAGALSGSLFGWVVSRCLGEAMLLASVGYAVLRTCAAPLQLRNVQPRAVLGWMRLGLTVNVALILRMAADSIPIVLMGGFTPKLVIGQFGIATLALTLATLPIAVLTQLTLPRLAAAAPDEERRVARTLVFRAVGGALVLAALGTLGGTTVARFASPQVHAGLVAITIILWTLPLRSLALAFGVLSLARSNYLGPVLVNLTEVVALLIVMTLRPFAGTVWTPLLATFIGAAVSAVGMVTQTLLIGARGRRRGLADALTMVD